MGLQGEKIILNDSIISRGRRIVYEYHFDSLTIFIFSVFHNGDHSSKYLNTIEKKDIQFMMNSINFEKGNFTFKGKSLPEIIFIEKN